MDFDFFNSNVQIPYPFKYRETVDRGAAASADISGLFVSATARLRERKEDRLGLLNMHVLSSTAFPTIQSAVATLRWLDDTTTISLDDADSDTTFTWNAYGDWAVFSWTKGIDISIQFVIPISAITTNGGNEEFVIAYDGGYAPQTTIAHEFQQSRILAGPGRVRRVYVKQGTELTLVADNGEDVLIQPGFNMEVTAVPPEAAAGRPLTRIALDAVPGAGRGKYLLCGGRQYLYTINGVGPDQNGRAQLAPEECYWVELPLRAPPTPIAPEHSLTESAQLLPNALRFHNSCLPCCSCEDYIKAYDNLRSLWNRAKAQSLKYQSLRDGYHQLLLAYDQVMGTLSTLTLAKYDDETIRVISSYTHENVDSALEFEFTFTLPVGVSLSYYNNSGVFSSSATGAYILNPTDPNGTPTVTVSATFQENVRSFWAGLWKLVGVGPGDEIEVSVTITDGTIKSATQTLTF